MSETKWTPGPWKHDNRDRDSCIKSGFTEALHEAEMPHELVISMGTVWGLGVDVAAIPAYSGRVEAAANARLIAAAPRLYAFAERFANLLGTPRPKLMDELFAEARAVTEQARGEEPKP